jgi:hypothetical protein
MSAASGMGRGGVNGIKPLRMAMSFFLLAI